MGDLVNLTLEHRMTGERKEARGKREPLSNQPTPREDDTVPQGEFRPTT